MSCEYCDNAEYIQLSKWSIMKHLSIRIKYDEDPRRAEFCPICGQYLGEDNSLTDNIDNAIWQFNNNMTYKNDALLFDGEYQKARHIIIKALEEYSYRHEPKEINI